MTTLYEDQKAKRDKAKRIEEKVYRSVNHRDKFCCRACGHRADPNTIGRLDRGHHHHIVFRSAGGKTTRQNVCLVCAECHDAIHHQSGPRKLFVSGNADATLTFGQGGRTWHD